MTPSLPARNETVRWNGAAWRVDNLDDNEVVLCHALNGQRESLTVPEWLEGDRSQFIERRVRPVPMGDGRPRKHAHMRWNEVTWQVIVGKRHVLATLASALVVEIG